MAASDKKLQSFTAFNSGEYSKDLAGRTDLESFGSSTRYTSNFLTQVSGGLKKFYGTRHVTEQSTTDDVMLIPFINKYEPMCFVVYAEHTDESMGLKVGLVYGNKYKDLAIQLPLSVKIRELRWQQVNDRLILCHHSVQPFTIDFYGLDDEGEYTFDTNTVDFKEVPYFPIGATNDYRGNLVASGISGTVTVTIPAGTSYIKSYLPTPLLNQSSYVRSARTTYESRSGYYQGRINNSTITLKRNRGGTVSTLVSGVVNSASTNVTRAKRWQGYYDSTVYVTDTITREKVLQVIKTVYPNAYIVDGMVVLADISDHQVGDEYFIDMSVGRIWAESSNGSEQRTLYNAATYNGEHYTPVAVQTNELDLNSLVGRKIKFYFNDDTVINPWWQNKSVSTGDYAYSNGHWYRAVTSGTCGNVQPSHTVGVRSDGGVTWRYVHSGSNTASVISVEDATTIKVQVANGELPVNPNNIYSNYAWSIWGKDDVHPSEIYMIGNRLGFVCNTKNYGAWNSISVTDDYFNFDTEEYGEQLDTSAIVHLIGNNESSNINWVLARNNLYMGGYSGEYIVKSQKSGSKTDVLTPTNTHTDNISNMGGKPIIPLKYKQLNMFVGITGKELYTIAYDYTTDDYTPKSMGYLTQHIMDRGIKRMLPLNNLDRNIYLLHDTKQLSLFNFAAEQKVMGFTELDFGGEVVDFCTTYSKDVVAGYVVIKRNTGKITIERFAIEEPNYMFDEITQGDGTLADFVPVPHFANKTVYIRYGLNFSQFIKVDLDENGDVSHDITTGVYLPQSDYFKVGIPMVSEVHTQPAFGNKVEGHQQQSISMYMRLVDSGAFEYGSSVDFDKYFRHEYWNTKQQYLTAHRLFTGDMKLEIPLGYAEAQNQGEGPYPNTSAVGINIKSDTPEPLNILSIQEIYR